MAHKLIVLLNGPLEYTTFNAPGLVDLILHVLFAPHAASALGALLTHMSTPPPRARNTLYLSSTTPLRAHIKCVDFASRAAVAAAAAHEA